MDSISLAAIVQGITECIPVSSSAHLVLLQKFSGFSGNIYDMSIGTTIATMIVFRRYIIQLIRESFCTWEAFCTIASAMTLAMLPTAVVGLLSYNKTNPVGKIINSINDNDTAIYLCTLLSCIILYISDKTSDTRENLHRHPIHTLLVGIAQCCAIIPGVSRLGITFSIARLLGYKRMESVRFSFVMAIPVHFAASLLHTKHIDSSFAYCNFIAMISALGTFSALSYIVHKLTATPFVIYRLMFLTITVCSV